MKEAASQAEETPGSTVENNSSTSERVANELLSRWRFWVLSVGVCLGLFLSIIDSSIVATSLYTIGTDLNSLGSVNWVALAYTLAYLGCAVAFARASDVIGRRNAFIIAYVIFFAFSLGCGFAQNIDQLIAFRSLQGVGGSGLYSLSMIILPEMCPPGMTQVIGSLVGMVIAGSGVIGPILGGVLTQYASWRWVFWINGPIGIVSLGIFLLSWPRGAASRQTHRRSWKTFDYFGTLLVIAAAVLLVFAFQNAGESHATIWSQAEFLAPLLCGVVCWVAVVVWGLLLDKKSWGKHLAPAFPLSLFRSRYYASSALATLFMGFPFFAIIFSFPMRAQVVSGRTTLNSGLRLLPMLCTTAVGSALSGKLNAKKNFLFETLVAGCSLMLLGCGLLTTIHGSQDDTKALGFLTFSGFGYGLATAAATILVSVEVPLADSAPGHGILAQMRVLGGSLGISTSTVLLRNEMRKRLGNLFTQYGQAGMKSFQGHASETRRNAVVLAYSESFRTGMIACTAIAAAALLIALTGYRSVRQDVQKQREKLVHDEIRRHTLIGETRGGK